MHNRRSSRAWDSACAPTIANACGYLLRCMRACALALLLALSPLTCSFAFAGSEPSYENANSNANEHATFGSSEKKPSQNGGQSDENSSEDETVSYSATFYIAMLNDDSQLPSSAEELRANLKGYTQGITLQNVFNDFAAVDNMRVEGQGSEFRILDFTGESVHAELAVLPTADQISAVCNSFDPEVQTVVWYVVKNQSDGIHIDGLLVQKAAVPTEPETPDKGDSDDGGNTDAPDKGDGSGSNVIGPEQPPDNITPVELNPIEPIEPTNPKPVVPSTSEPSIPEMPAGPSMPALPTNPKSEDAASQPMQTEQYASFAAFYTPTAYAAPEATASIAARIAGLDDHALSTVTETVFTSAEGLANSVNPTVAAYTPMSKEAATAMKATGIAGLVVVSGCIVVSNAAAALSAGRIMRVGKSLDLPRPRHRL